MVTKNEAEIKHMITDAEDLSGQFMAMADILKQCHDASDVFDFIFYGIPDDDQQEQLVQAKDWFRPLILGDQGKLSRLLVLNFNERFGKNLVGTSVACGDPDSRNDMVLYSLPHDYRLTYQGQGYHANWRLKEFSFFDKLLNHYDQEPQLHIAIKVNGIAQLLNQQVGHFRWDSNETPIKLSDRNQQLTLLAKYLMRIVDEKKLDKYLSQLKALPMFYQNFDPTSPDNEIFKDRVEREINYLTELRHPKGWHRADIRAYQNLNQTVHFVLNDDINCKLIDWFLNSACFVFNHPEDIQEQLNWLKVVAVKSAPSIKGLSFEDFMDKFNQQLSDFLGRPFQPVDYHVELKHY